MEKRSYIMSRIRSKDTKPELAVLGLSRTMGMRFVAHSPKILGKPDMSNARRMVAVFVDGCFWHKCPKHYREPRTNADFWKAKVLANERRRKLVRKSLRLDGWTVLEFWEHDTRDPRRLQRIAKRIFRHYFRDSKKA